MKNIEELAYKLELNSNSPLSKWMLKASHLNVSGDKFPSSFHIPCTSIGPNTIQQIFGPVLMPAIVLGVWIQRCGMFSLRRLTVSAVIMIVCAEYREVRRKGKLGTISERVC